MKKCSFCDHYGHTEKGEEVCTKHLIYIGDHSERDLPCDGVDLSIESVFPIVAFTLIAIIVTLILLAS